MSAAIIPWLAVPAFLLFFAGMWLGITKLLLALAGWRRLEERFPDTGEAALFTTRPRFATMGSGVKFERSLTLSACRSGLRVTIGPLLGRGRKPFLVPWSEIAAGPGRGPSGRPIFKHPIRLVLGAPEVGRLTLEEQTWVELQRR